MGLELKTCPASISGLKSVGKLYVDSNELEFRSKQITWTVKTGKGTRAKVIDGDLRVSRGSKSATFAIGDEAARWADKILHPPNRITKLGLKRGQKYVIKGKFESAFHEEISEAELQPVRQLKSCDLVFVLLTSTSDLKIFKKALAHSNPGTHLWTVWPKGVDSIKQADVIGTARQFGIGPGKGISFDSTHSAMRFTKK
ncbi:MAG: hypothetical protein AAGA30_06425 [Planctomycetota bacterium]